MVPVGHRPWCLPSFLAFALVLPADSSAALLEVVSTAGLDVASSGAWQSRWFLAGRESVRPLRNRDAQWLSDPNPMEGERGEALGAPASAEPGSAWGAAAFALALVPLAYVLLVTCFDSSIVVVARAQARPSPRSAAFRSEVVLVASIEHDFAYDLDAQRPERAKQTAGGLGKVAGQLQRIHPTDLISVHPVFGEDTRYGFERPDAGEAQPEARRANWQQDESVCVTVEGALQTVRVYRRTVAPERDQETMTPQVTYLMLDHPWFRQRTGIYLDQPGSVGTLRFFSLWNQAVGVLIAREDPAVYQCPDYHTALAPWYALRACGRERPPPRVVVVLHNAEYQGAISSQQLTRRQRNRLARILDLPRPLLERRMMVEGGFNMLQAGMQYMLLTQRGYGVCAVSETYAEESKVKHRVLWPLPEVVGLDNPMLENERPRPGPPLPERRRAAKDALYAHQDFRADAGAGEEGRGFGYLRGDNPSARIFVFLGRWVKQKGMDYIADIAEWMVSTHENLQLVIIGPPGDSFGTYTSQKLKVIATDPRFLGRIKVLPEFYNINNVHQDVKFAFDFCLMPSRDEPFGYVDIEFGWFGALTVGAITGGLGKVPGIYYIPSNVNSATHICHLFKGCVNKAMELSDAALLAIAELATQYSFPVETWQADLLELYKKAYEEGNRVGVNAQYLRSYRGVSELLDGRQPVPRAPRVPRRPVVRTGLGFGSLEARPTPFSQAQMEEEHRTGTAGALRSWHDGREDEMPQDEFIRSEVADSAIQDRVGQLVQQGAEGSSSRCCHGRGLAASAQDVLAVTQWEAMREGEYEEHGERGAELRAPFCGLCRCLTKFLTLWLARESCGLKRIDAFIAIHYLTAPLLQALCVSQLPSPELNKWPAVLEVLVQPFAIVFWTKVSMSLQPNRLLAYSLLLRVPLLFLSVVAGMLGLREEGLLLRLALFCCLGFLAGSDQLFVYYNFMGAAVGDISKLALRMGTCNGILVATSSFGQAAIGYAVENVPVITSTGATPLSFLGLLFDVLLALVYICAPAPYREFRLPDWDLEVMWKHRRTLTFLAMNLVFGAVTDTSISGAAVVVWRSALPPFKDHRFLGFDPAMAYAWLVPALMGSAVVAWSLLLHRLPNHAFAMVKAGAFLLAPPALMRCALVLAVKNEVSFTVAVDSLFLLSLLLDAVQSTCAYVAVLSVVGSRWRFVSFLTVTLFFRGLLAAFVHLVLAVAFGIEGMQSGAFAERWMPAIVAVALLQWLLSVGGFFTYDRESQALLTKAKRQLARRNNRNLREYLQSLER